MIVGCCHCTIATAILIQKYTCVHITTILYSKVYIYTHYNHSFQQECGSESDSDSIQSPPGVSGQLRLKTPVSVFFLFFLQKYILILLVVCLDIYLFFCLSEMKIVTCIIIMYNMFKSIKIFIL